MKTSIKQSKNIVNFEIKLTKKELMEYLEKEVDNKIKTVKMDGFREGKMPKSMFLKKYGYESVFPNTIDKIINEGYFKILKDNDLKVISEPTIDWEKLMIDVEKGFEVKGNVELLPEIELKEYKDVYKQIKKATSKVTKKEVKEEIEKLLENKAIVEIKEGKSKAGDTVIIDFEGFVNKKPFEGGKGESYPLTLGSNTFIPGFEDQLIGKEAGESVDVKVKFPEDYQVEDLKGKEAVFKTTIHEVKTKKIPKLTKEIIKEIPGFEVETKEELEKAIEEKILSGKKQQIENKFYNDLMVKLIKLNKIKAPEKLIERETDMAINQFSNQIQQQGISLDMYLQMLGMDIEALRKQMYDDSKRRIEESLLIDAIIKAEKIEVLEKDVKEKIKEIAEKQKMTQKEVKERLGDLNNLKEQMKYDKAYKLILGE